MKSKTAGSL